VKLFKTITGTETTIANLITEEKVSSMNAKQATRQSVMWHQFSYRVWRATVDAVGTAGWQCWLLKERTQSCLFNTIQQRPMRKT